MQFRWTEQAYRWFVDASNYTGYSKKLAELLLSEMPAGGTLCDLGCGAALVDFELAPFFSELTCVDISPEVIRLVNKQICQRGLAHMRALCADTQRLDGSWDTVMALLHGGPESVIPYLKMAKKALVIATHGTKTGKIGPENRRIQKSWDVNSIRAFLDKRKIRFSLLESALEYGQPLTDLDEAKAFVHAYAAPMGEAELDAYLRTALRKTGRDDFPYYLPNERTLGIFVIRRSENEEI